MKHDYGSDWQQWFFDLLANNDVSLLIEGELNQLDATLKIEGTFVGEVVGASDLGDAITQLMDGCNGKVHF